MQWRQPSEVFLQAKHLKVEKAEADGVPDTAVAYIMDDDLESAEAGLANGSSSFHKVCRTFLLGRLGSRLMDFGH